MNRTPFLPDRYAMHYSPLVLKKFALCIFTVAWKLAQPKWVGLACVAEEIALRAIILTAHSILEMRDQKPFDFGDFEDEAFEDLDVEYLFTPALDGIEDSATGERLGIASLDLDDWFKAFHGGKLLGSAVHPFAEDDPAMTQ